jgi:hypothetical protein
MKCLKLMVLLIFAWQVSSAQIPNPLHWTWRVVHVDGDIYDLIFSVKIDTPWHTYSQTLKGDAPRPTLISIDINPDIELIGSITEGGPGVKIIDDPMMNEKIKIFQDKAIFTQKIKVKKPTKVTGYVEAMAVNSNTAMQPNDVSFKIDVGTMKKARIVLDN